MIKRKSQEAIVLEKDKKIVVLIGQGTVFTAPVYAKFQDTKENNYQIIHFVSSTLLMEYPGAEELLRESFCIVVKTSDTVNEGFEQGKFTCLERTTNYSIWQKPKLVRKQRVTIGDKNRQRRQK